MRDGNNNAVKSRWKGTGSWLWTFMYQGTVSNIPDNNKKPQSAQ